LLEIFAALIAEKARTGGHGRVQVLVLALGNSPEVR
jgi:hypothetical protein